MVAAVLEFWTPQSLIVVGRAGKGDWEKVIEVESGSWIDADERVALGLGSVQTSPQPLDYWRRSASFSALFQT